MRIYYNHMHRHVVNQDEIISAFLSANNPRFPYEHWNRDNCVQQSGDTVFAIPEGKKIFVWFTLWNNKEICFLLFRLNDKIIEVSVVNISASASIFWGTVMYGTLFTHNNRPVFAAEELSHYKGRKISAKKFTLLGYCIANEISPWSFQQNFLIIGLPVILSRDATSLSHIPYPVSHVQIRQHGRIYRESVRHFFTKRHNVCSSRTAPRRTQIFLARPDIKNDVYHIYSCKDNTYVGVAAIPDYKTSIYMNTIFRRIKENKNLDTLEESDSESEFEDTLPEKLICVSCAKISFFYHARSQKWAPIVDALPV